MDGIADNPLSATFLHHLSGHHFSGMEQASLPHNIDIHRVNQSADEINAGSQQVGTSATELSTLAENLNQMVARFRLN